MNALDNFDLDTMRELAEIELDQVSGGGGTSNSWITPNGNWQWDGGPQALQS